MPQSHLFSFFRSNSFFSRVFRDVSASENSQEFVCSKWSGSWLPQFETQQMVKWCKVKWKCCEVALEPPWLGSGHMVYGMHWYNQKTQRWPIYFQQLHLMSRVRSYTFSSITTPLLSKGIVSPSLGLGLCGDTLKKQMCVQKKKRSSAAKRLDEVDSVYPKIAVVLYSKSIYYPF